MHPPPRFSVRPSQSSQTRGHRGLRALARRGCFAIVVAVFMLLRGSPAFAANLWVAFEPGADTWRSRYEDYFACVTGASDFNTMLTAWGRPAVYFAGDALVGHCGRNNWTAPLSQAQCVIESASFASRVQPGDTILYVNTGPCGGYNDRHLSITINGTLVPIHYGEVGDITSSGSASLACETSAGLHEVYEANTNGISADCCSHESYFGGASQPECARQPGQSEYGTYTLNGCAAETFTAQELSPVNETYNLAACSELTVNTASICAQTRTVRDAGTCVNGNLVRCSFGPTVEDCHGNGCSDSPTPHCNQPFDAQCQLEYPTSMCAGTTSAATVRCTNTGGAAWSGDVQLAALPQGEVSPFGAEGWVSASIAADVSPSMVGVGAVGSFEFVLRAPAVSAATTYMLPWALVQSGTYESQPPASAMTMTITVAPCAADADSGPVDDAAAADVATARDVAITDASAVHDATGTVTTDAATRAEAGAVRDAATRAEAGAVNDATGGDVATDVATRADAGADSATMEGGAMESSGTTPAGCACRVHPTGFHGDATALAALAFGLGWRRRTRRSNGKRTSNGPVA